MRLYVTGDLGRVDGQGRIEVLGRVAHMLELRGHRIQTPELIETMGTHMSLSQALPRIQTVGGDQALALYYTADAAQRARWGIENGQERLPEALVAALRAVLPGYCVPSHPEAVPLRPVSGKTDFAALPRVHATTETAPEKDAPPAIHHAARLLRIGMRDVAPEGPFREQDGDSLAAMDLTLDLEGAFGRAVNFDWALSLPLVRLHALLSEHVGAERHQRFEHDGPLLTGATGFLGGHMLRAMVRRLPERHVVYRLVRPGQRDPEARLDAVARAAGVPRDRVVPVAGALDAVQPE